MLLIIVIDFITETEPPSLLSLSLSLSLLPKVQSIWFTIAAGRVGCLKFCQSVSTAAAYIKEGKPAHGYLALVVMVDTAPQYTCPKSLLVSVSASNIIY